jgi:predicted lysophospholipase L1 biosynthesis ABC-type transport system permease subunit
MTDVFPVVAALATGLVINILDIACTLIFVAKAWEAELRRQGLEPRKLTPPYYIVTNFVGGIVLTFVYLQFAKSMSPGLITAVIASLPIWFVSRIYGGGHVVMGQMPLRIFTIMSIGLGIGYIAGGQLLRVLLGH